MERSQGKRKEWKRKGLLCIITVSAGACLFAGQAMAEPEAAAVSMNIASPGELQDGAAAEDRTEELLKEFALLFDRKYVARLGGQQSDDGSVLKAAAGEIAEEKKEDQAAWTAMLEQRGKEAITAKLETWMYREANWKYDELERKMRDSSHEIEWKGEGTPWETAYQAWRGIYGLTEQDKQEELSAVIDGISPEKTDIPGADEEGASDMDGKGEEEQPALVYEDQNIVDMQTVERDSAVLDVVKWGITAAAFLCIAAFGIAVYKIWHCLDELLNNLKNQEQEVGKWGELKDNWERTEEKLDRLLIAVLPSTLEEAVHKAENGAAGMRGIRYEEERNISENIGKEQEAAVPAEHAQDRKEYLEEEELSLLCKRKYSYKEIEEYRPDDFVFCSPEKVEAVIKNQNFCEFSDESFRYKRTEDGRLGISLKKPEMKIRIITTSPAGVFWKMKLDGNSEFDMRSEMKADIRSWDSIWLELDEYGFYYVKETCRRPILELRSKK